MDDENQGGGSFLGSVAQFAGLAWLYMKVEDGGRAVVNYDRAVKAAVKDEFGVTGRKVTRAMKKEVLAKGLVKDVSWNINVLPFSQGLDKGGLGSIEKAYNGQKISNEMIVNSFKHNNRAYMDQLSAAGFSDDEVKILKDFANSKNSESWISTHLGTDKITSEGDDLVESILKSKKNTSGYSTPKVLDPGITSAPKEMGAIHGTHNIKPAVKPTITENVIGSGVSSDHPMLKHLNAETNFSDKKHSKAEVISRKRTSNKVSSNSGNTKRTSSKLTSRNPKVEKAVLGVDEFSKNTTDATKTLSSKKQATEIFKTTKDIETKLWGVESRIPEIGSRLKELRSDIINSSDKMSAKEYSESLLHKKWGDYDPSNKAEKEAYKKAKKAFNKNPDNKKGPSFDRTKMYTPDEAQKLAGEYQKNVINPLLNDNPEYKAVKESLDESAKEYAQYKNAMKSGTENVVATEEVAKVATKETAEEVTKVATKETIEATTDKKTFFGKVKEKFLNSKKAPPKTLTQEQILEESIKKTEAKIAKHSSDIISRTEYLKSKQPSPNLTWGQMEHKTEAFNKAKADFIAKGGNADDFVNTSYRTPEEIAQAVKRNEVDLKKAVDSDKNLNYSREQLREQNKILKTQQKELEVLKNTQKEVVKETAETATKETAKEVAENSGKVVGTSTEVSGKKVTKTGGKKVKTNTKKVAEKTAEEVAENTGKTGGKKAAKETAKKVTNSAKEIAKADKDYIAEGKKAFAYEEKVTRYQSRLLEEFAEYGDDAIKGLSETDDAAKIISQVKNYHLSEVERLNSSAWGKVDSATGETLEETTKRLFNENVDNVSKNLNKEIFTPEKKGQRYYDYDASKIQAQHHRNQQADIKRVANKKGIGVGKDTTITDDVINAVDDKVDDVAKATSKAAEKTASASADDVARILSKIDDSGELLIRKVKPSVGQIVNKGVGFVHNFTKYAQKAAQTPGVKGNILRGAGIAGRIGLKGLAIGLNAWMGIDTLRIAGNIVINTYKNSDSYKEKEEKHAMVRSKLTYEQMSSFNDTVLSARVSNDNNINEERELVSRSIAAGKNVNEYMKVALGGYSDVLSVNKIRKSGR